MIYKLMENRAYRSYLGGSRIDKFRGKSTCVSGSFPEDWTASTVRAVNPGREDIFEGYGRTCDGTYIKDLIDEDMPILVKLLDSDERLVIQAHPTREFARKHLNSPVGKAECWYFIDTDENACVYAGFKEGITRDKWIELFNKQDTEGMLACLHRFDVKVGDCIFIPGGLPHAIGGGCLMVELQEPSDLMVIPERTTPSGRVLADSKLHGGLGFEKMFDVFHYDGYNEEVMKRRLMPRRKHLSDAASMIIGKSDTGIFSMYAVNASTHFELSSRYAVMIVTDGEVLINGELYRKGEALLSTDEKELVFEGDNFGIVICE